MPNVNRIPTGDHVLDDSGRISKTWQDYFLSLQPRAWGQTILAAGAAVVSSPLVQSSSIVLLTRADASGNPSAVLRVGTIIPSGVNPGSFQIKSSDIFDTGKANWALFV